MTQRGFHLNPAPRLVGDRTSSERRQEALQKVLCRAAGMQAANDAGELDDLDGHLEDLMSFAKEGLDA